MTTTISEKDKKLLIKLVIGLVIFGILYLVSKPLFEQNMKLAQAISEETYKKEENELKTKSLLALKLVTEDNEKTLMEASEMFYPVMTDTQIDDRITSQVMEYKLIAIDLGIAAPKDGLFTTLNSYKMVPEDDKIEGGPYTGLHTAKVTLSVIGEHRDLQRFLDANINAGVKQRVVSYLWSKSKDGQYGLTMTMELYMCEDIQEYLAAEAEETTAEE